MASEREPTAGEYTSSVERLRAEYLEMRASGFGFTDLYAAEWDHTMVAHDAAVRAEALSKVANEWQQGHWADAPRYADPARERIATAQFVTDWLRDHAAKASEVKE